MADLFEEARKRELTKRSENDIITFGEDSQNLIDEVISSKQKITPEDVIGIVRDQNNRIVWLEKGHLGNNPSGYIHIIDEHENDFNRKGIASSNIADFVLSAVSEGEIIGYQGKGTGRPIYKITYNGKEYTVAITIGSNGYIVGANPCKIKEIKND